METSIMCIPETVMKPHVQGIWRYQAESRGCASYTGLGFDGLIGYSPIAMAKNAVGMTLACEEYGASFFANGANPGGVLEHPGVLKDPSKVRESWNSVYRGVNNAHKIAVLEEGMKYQQIASRRKKHSFLRQGNSRSMRSQGFTGYRRIWSVILDKVELFQYRAAVLGVRKIHT